MNSALNTLQFLLNSDEYNSSDQVLRFLKSELDRRNTEVLEFFFANLSKHKMVDKFFKEEFFQIILRSHWPKAHTMLAEQLASSPYYLSSALNVLASNNQVFDETIDVIVKKWMKSEEKPEEQLHLWESLALSAIQNNKPELYALCHQRTSEIDLLVPPFEFQHGRFCEHAVEKGAWWAVKAIIEDRAKPYIFYKSFEDATKFAPVDVLHNLYTAFPHHFTVEFCGRAAEFLCKREQTSEMFELLAEIVLHNDQIKLNAQQRVLQWCQPFLSDSQHELKALRVAEKIWLSTHPLFLMRSILGEKGAIQSNASLLRHMNENHPESYATLFDFVQRGNSCWSLPANIIDDLMFTINDETDRLIVQKGHNSEKVNILRQKMHLNEALETQSGSKKATSRKM